MAGARDIYPNAPLVLTAFEVRHSTTGPVTPAQERKIRELFGALLPVTSRVPAFDIVAPGGPDQSLRQEAAPRFSSRDRTLAVTFRSAGLVVEATRYAGWESFSSVLNTALRARAEIAELPAGVERVGLRYIDEIRAPGVEGESVAAWNGWIDDSLLGPVRIGAELGFSQGGSQGLVLFRTSAGTDLALRYGARDGVAVEPNSDLRRLSTAFGAFFLLDIDSFWTVSDEIPEFSVDSVMSLAHTLHAPVRGLFERAITDKLREEVLENG